MAFRTRAASTAAAVLVLPAAAGALEPNETFATRTIFAPGVLVADDRFEVRPAPAPPGDVDYFSFTGLPAGRNFFALSRNPTAPGNDPRMRWLDAVGSILVETDDDLGVHPRITGAVPASGILNFGVTGTEDFDWVGDHFQSGRYLLEVVLETVGLPGDFSGDSFVDAADYTVWRDQSLSAAEYTTWRTNYGRSSLATAVPEPSVLLLAGLATGLALGNRR
jgi:hypothetical protein